MDPTLSSLVIDFTSTIIANLMGILTETSVLVNIALVGSLLLGIWWIVRIIKAASLDTFG